MLLIKFRKPSGDTSLNFMNLGIALNCAILMMVISLCLVSFA